MNARDPAPVTLRRVASLALFAATALSLANLPADELPLPWLLAFTVPGAVLGMWSRLAREPWRRALLAVILQAGACYGALMWEGHMSRPAALACTILPPLAFSTTRSHDADPSLALFLSFCVLLVGVILDGVHYPLLVTYGVAALLTLHFSTLLQAFRSSSPRRPASPLRAGDVFTPSAMMLSCLLATVALDRTLSWIPSPSRGGGGDDVPAASGGEGRQVGLDDSFLLDGVGGLLSELTGEQLVRAAAPGGAELPPDLYLRCGFFTVPGMDQWRIGPLELRAQSTDDGHVFDRGGRFARPTELEIERFGGAAKFVFLPPHTLQVRGLDDLVVDSGRQWIRPRRPRSPAPPYVATYQEIAPATSGDRIDSRAIRYGMHTLPTGLDEGRFNELMAAWGVGNEPRQAMQAIARGLARHCRYDRRDPIGPFPHAIENFLFSEDDRRGYCMHFASAAALMLRMRGVPCRIGVGLYGGKPDGERDGARLFGSQNAHAWVEVLFEGRGYEIYDPTPPDLRGRGFVEDDRAAGPSDAQLPMEGSRIKPIARAIEDLLSTPWTWTVALAAVLLVAVLPRRQPKRPEQRRSSVAPKARRALLKLLRALSKAGHRRGRGQTLEQFARELDDRERLPAAVRDAFEAYQEVRFGGRAFDEGRARRLEAGLRAAQELGVQSDEPGATAAASA